MASENEAIADILAEIRTYGEQPPPRLMWLDIADRIEAAWKRERERDGRLLAEPSINVGELRETLAEISGSMREFAADVKESHDGIAPDVASNLCAGIREYATWLEFASDRHLSEGPVGNAAARDEVVLRLSKEEYKGMQEALSEHDRLCEMLSESRMSVGNAAATREALEKVAVSSEYALKHDDLDCGDLLGFIEEMGQDARAALSAPERNCDRSTSIEEARTVYCSESGRIVSIWDGVESGLFEEWLLATAEQEGGAK